MGLPPFTSGDFELFSREKTRDPEWDGPRLALKRKLQAWGEAAEARIRAEAEVDFKVQTSLHRPYKYNRYRVESQRVLLTPPAERKKELKRLLGEAFKQETSSGVTQMHLALTITLTHAETSLRVPPQAWWHGLAWQKAAQEDPAALCALLTDLPGEFFLEIQGGRGAVDCESVDTRTLSRLLAPYRPGEQWITVHRIHPRDGLLEGMEDQEGLLLDDLASLAPVHRFLEAYTWKGA